jgi:hypothetical protein
LALDGMNQIAGGQLTHGPHRQGLALLARLLQAGLGNGAELIVDASDGLHIGVHASAVLLACLWAHGSLQPLGETAKDVG